MNNEAYKKIQKEYKLRPNYFRNGLRAFIVGGVIGVIAELLLHLYSNLFDISIAKATSPMIVTFIIATCLLTGLGVFKKIGRYAGGGTLIPITGFANSVCSAAIEHKREGLITGIGANIFKLAGSVITYGVVSATIFALIRYYFF